jgi:hypothetical protein
MTWFLRTLRDLFFEKRVSYSLGTSKLLLIFLWLSAFGADARSESIMLSWRDNSANESGFKIERSIDGVLFEEIGVVGSNVTAFEDRHDLELGREYFYRVKAFNEYGDSGYTNTANGSVDSSNTEPTITSISDASIVEGDSTGSLAFTIGDAETSASVLSVSASSSNESLIPSGNISLGGGGGDRTVSLTPVTGQTGSATISIVVDDGTDTTTATFVLTVTIASLSEDQTISVSFGGLLGGVYESGQSDAFQVLVSGAQSNIQNVQFFDNSSYVKTENVDPYDFTFNASGAGNHTLKAVVTTDLGVYEKTVVVDVQLPPNTVPTTDDSQLHFYFGEFGPSGEGRFAMMTRADGSGVFVGEVASSVSAVLIEEFHLTGIGKFSISVTNLGVLSGNVSARGVSGELEFFGTDPRLLWLGTLEDEGVATEGVAGFYRFEKGPAERLVILAGSDGRGFVVSESESSRSTGVIALKRGVSTVTLEDGLVISLSIGKLSGEVDATIVRRADSEAAEDASRSVFSNFSVRLPIDGGATAIAGFVVSGPGEKRLLVRAVGPTLRDLGVGNAAGDTRLTLYRMGTDGLLAENDDWWDVEDQGADVAHEGMLAGAFSLNTSSKDAAFVVSIPSGLYWAFVANEAQDSGTALIEVYDLDELNGTGSDTNLVNLSVRGITGYGSEPIIAGFVISGDDPMGLMFRAMGRELQAFGVSNTLDDPSFNVFGMGGGLPIAGNDDWTLERESLSDLAAHVGAFPFEDGSKSAAQALWLDPGLYTAIAMGNGVGSGEVLIEMYAIPIDSAK